MTVRTRAQLIADANSALPDNVAGEISPEDVRERIKDLADSARLAEDLGDAAGKNVGSGANDVAAGNHGHGAATSGAPGFMAAADKQKLDGIEAGADVTDAQNVGSSIHGASAKTGPVDADAAPLIDSAASNALKKITWANVKAALKTYFDAIYAAASHTHSDATTSVAGFMSSGDKTKLNGISAGATANTGTVTSVSATVPTGFSVSGSPVTSSGTLAISYAAGYQGYTSAEASKLSGIAPGATANTGTVTSVTASVPTGFAISGGPITSSGTLAITYSSGYQGYTTSEASKLSGIETGADVTDAGNVGSSIHGASAKTTPVDADTVALIDSAASNVLKKLSWSNIKSTLKTYFDTLYATASHTHSGATTSVAGFMSTSDKSKLDGIAAGAQVNTVTSVAGKTGAVTLAKGDVGLGNVDNTSDANKPVSTATQNALDDKAETDLSNVSQSDARSKVGTGTMAYRDVTISTSDPSGGSNGDVWLKV